MLVGTFNLEPSTNPDYFHARIETPLYGLLKNGSYTQLASLYEYLIETIPEQDLPTRIREGRVDGFTIRTNGQSTLPEAVIAKMLETVNANSAVKVIYQKP